MEEKAGFLKIFVFGKFNEDFMIPKSLVYKLIGGIGWRYGYEVIKKGEAGQVVGDQYLEKFFREFKIETVVDIGANGGQYANRIRQFGRYMGVIHSYEPIPELYQKLIELSSNDKSWKVFPYAVDALSGKAVFNVMFGSEFSSLLKPSEVFHNSFGGQSRIEREISVDVISLGDVANTVFENRQGHRALLKLDTQGTELRILSSDIEAAKRFDAIQVELSFRQIYKDSPSAFEVVSWMRGAGFELSSLFANNAGHFPHLLEMDGVFVKNDLLLSHKL